jgi:hypothetical protein
VCPFHGGTNKTAFSVNLDNGGFYCFNCGIRGGDIIAFTMQRNGLSFPDACKRLGIWKDARMSDIARRESLALQVLSAMARNKAIREEENRKDEIREWRRDLWIAADIEHQAIAELHAAGLNALDELWEQAAKAHELRCQYDIEYCNAAGIELGVLWWR